MYITWSVLNFVSCLLGVINLVVPVHISSSPLHGPLETKEEPCVAFSDYCAYIVGLTHMLSPLLCNMRSGMVDISWLPVVHVFWLLTPFFTTRSFPLSPPLGCEVPLVGHNVCPFKSIYRRGYYQHESTHTPQGCYICRYGDPPWFPFCSQL